MNDNGEPNANKIVDRNNQLIQILLKYTLQGVAVAVAASLIPKNKIKGREVIVLGLTAAVVFLLLDIYAPSIGIGARHGAGFSIGSQLVGGLGTAVGAVSPGPSSPVEGFSSRNGRMMKMHNRMVQNDIFRMRHTGGPLHEEPMLNSDYMTSQNGNNTNANANGKEGFSEVFKMEKMEMLNQIGKVGVTSSRLHRLGANSE